jgi:hypothetical protein
LYRNGSSLFYTRTDIAQGSERLNKAAAIQRKKERERWMSESSPPIENLFRIS